MYPPPLVTYGFNHQSTINITPANYYLQQENIRFLPPVPNYQSNEKKKVSLPEPIETKQSSHRPKSYTPYPSDPDQLLPQQFTSQTSLPKHSKIFPRSYSHGAIQERIQRERKAHTMAPLTQISGPSSTPKVKLFASIIAPSGGQGIQSHRSKHKQPNIEMFDDDAPVIVKVKYDPLTGARPSEAAVRQALSRQLHQRSNKNNDPIIIDFRQPHIRPTKPAKLDRPIQHRGPSLRIEIPPEQQQQQQNSFPFTKVPHPLPHTSHKHQSSKHGHTRSKQTSEPLKYPQQFETKKLPRLSTRNTFQPIKSQMATHPPSAYLNDQQNLSRRPHTAPAPGEVFRPPAVKDTPELSNDNLLQMLNQIPDLRGRQFKIEYAPSSAPDGYPFPFNEAATANSYPEPVVIDTLPNNVIQHVKNSNNPALTAALEATIRQEQQGPRSNAQQPTIRPQQQGPRLNAQQPTIRPQQQGPRSNAPQPTIRPEQQGPRLNAQPTNVIQHRAPPNQNVQQSRAASVHDSESNTEVSSSDTSSSEESDTEELKNVPSAKTTNNIPFVGPLSSKYQSH